MCISLSNTINIGQIRITHFRSAQFPVRVVLTLLTELPHSCIPNYTVFSFKSMLSDCKCGSTRCIWYKLCNLWGAKKLYVMLIHQTHKIDFLNLGHVISQSFKFYTNHHPFSHQNQANPSWKTHPKNFPEFNFFGSWARLIISH